MRKPYLLIALLLMGAIGFGASAFAQSAMLTSNIPIKSILIDSVQVSNPGPLQAIAYVDTTSGIGPYTYEWLPSTITYSNPVPNNFAIVEFDPGSDTTFTIVATDRFGCTDTMDFNSSGGPINGFSDEIEGLVDLTIFPNPNQGDFHVSLIGKPFADDVNLVIRDQLGRIVYFEDLPRFTGKMERDIQLSPLSAGVYYVGLGSGDKMIFRKLIIE